MIILHCIICTKTGKITSKLEEPLYTHISSLISKLGSQLITINGMSDHIHFLIKMRTDMSINYLIQKIKINTQRWIKAETSNSRFQWEETNFVYSVSPPKISHVNNYIRNQKRLHIHQTFQDERLILESQEKLFVQETAKKVEKYAQT